MHISVSTNSLDAENVVPTLALGLPPKSSASLPCESTSIVLQMIGASDPPQGDAIPALPRPHLDSLSYDPKDRSPDLPRSAQRSIGSSTVG